MSKAKSFAAVKMSWTRVAHLTLQQFTNVSTTEKKENRNKDLILFEWVNRTFNVYFVSQRKYYDFYITWLHYIYIKLGCVAMQLIRSEIFLSSHILLTEKVHEL